MNRKDFYLQAYDVIDQTPINSVVRLLQFRKGTEIKGKYIYKQILQEGIDFIPLRGNPLYSDHAIRTINDYYKNKK